MTKEEIKTPREEHDRLKKREGVALVTIAYIALIGGCLVILGLVQVGFYDGMKSYDYLTDDGIAYRDLQNATYTYEPIELDELRNDCYLVAIIGGGVLGAAITAFAILAYINPANTSVKAHKIHCDGTYEKTHCPECGLKLSKLEKK